ncbi:hypothetical protein P8452_40737 [Trifolium repens]|nr:protein SEH1 [Trifolium repens]WJX54906.1 hypothetical protein P8452_40737 [Trifolium repens]
MRSLPSLHKGLSIWHLGLNPDHNRRLSDFFSRSVVWSLWRVQVWQMQWDMSGMTLATTGNNGMVRLRQSNLNGVWHHQAASFSR